MRQWMVLYRKEMLEMWRSGKWLWVPVVFLLLGVMQPISSYYMPELLKNAGNLPEGAVIQLPPAKPHEVMAGTLSQYGTMGVLIMVLATMGVVAAERSAGITSIIMVKPVRHTFYITAKWAAMLTLGVTSYLAGYLASWYYTELLIGHVDVARAFAGFVVWGLWLIFILTVTLLMSVCLRANGAIAFVTLFIAAAVSLLTGFLSRYAGWSPGRLSGHAGAILSQGRALDAFAWSLGFTIFAIAAMIFGSVWVFRRQEYSE